MLNLGEFIQLYDTKERGNDINIKINNDTPLHQSILDLERTICDTKSEREYDVFEDYRSFKDLLYNCRMDCFNTAINKVTFENGEITLEIQEGGGGNSRFDDWRVMFSGLISRDNGKIVIINTRDNMQVVSAKLINLLPDGEVTDWYVGHNGVFYIGVDMRIVNQKLVEEITKYNAQFDRFNDKGDLRLMEQSSFNVTGNISLVHKIEDIIEENRVEEYLKYNYCGIYTYVDRNNFDNIKGKPEQEQIAIVEKSLRDKHPEVLEEIEIQQITWADNDKCAVQFRCRSLHRVYIDAPFDMYIKLSNAGYSAIENRNIPRAVGDLNNHKWYLKMYE